MKLWHLALIGIGGPQVIIFTFHQVRDTLQRRRHRLALRAVRPQLIVMNGGKKR